MNNFLLFVIALCLLYILFKPKETFDDVNINQQLLNFLKNNQDISFIIYAKFLNEHDNTNTKLVAIDTFNQLKSLGPNITIDDINKFN
jgi:hypothetical protein